MTRTPIGRRQLLIGAAALVAAALPAQAQDLDLELHVMKDPGCGCCDAWIAILRQDGFAVTSDHLGPADLVRYKLANGIPEAMFSCHTGRIGGYMIEGHVPARDIRRLLAARPDAVGLAVPGMPIGSPGMGPETAREAYAVHLIRRDGRSEVFSRYDAA